MCWGQVWERAAAMVNGLTGRLRPAVKLADLPPDEFAAAMLSSMFSEPAPPSEKVWPTSSCRFCDLAMLRE